MEFLSEELKCVLCVNYMKTSRGCDGNCRHNKECEDIIKKVAELERLAKIGRATEIALKHGFFIYDVKENREGDIVRYDYDYTIEDLLLWHEREEGNEK